MLGEVIAIAALLQHVAGAHVTVRVGDRRRALAGISEGGAVAAVASLLTLQIAC
jgi:hypothetical protein